MKKPKTTRKGYEWLQSDVEILNLLLEKQALGDEILNLFNIQFMDDSYLNEDMEEINRIYVIRDQTIYEGHPTNFDGDGYKALVEIIIRTSKYDYIPAQQLLKTAVKCIAQYIEHDPMRPYCKIREIVPKYVKPGKLREYRLELLCTEIKEKTAYPTLSEDLRVDLCVQVGIENTDKEWHKLYPQIVKRHKPVKLHSERKCKIRREYDYDMIDEITFGGGKRE